MSKSTLRLINLISLSIVALLFLGFAIYQYQVDGSAQAIVQYNSSLLTPVKQQTQSLAQQLANQAWDYDRAPSLDSQKTWQEIERSTQSLANQIRQMSASKIREGINSPSVNNAEFVKEKLINLANQNLLLAGMVSAHTCLQQQSVQFRTQQTDLDRNLESYGSTADYAEGLGILIKIDRNYQSFMEMIKTAINCFPPPLQVEGIYTDVQATANTDLASISTYQQKFLQPLIKLYQAEDYSAVPDFQATNREHSQVKIVFPELWRNAKGTNSSYLATQFRSIAMRIVSDTKVSAIGFPITYI